MDIQTCYENLANAIIIQAAKDYREVLHQLLYEPDNELAIMKKKKIERFFQSESYCALTSIDSRTLIERLNEEVAR